MFIGGIMRIYAYFRIDPECKESLNDYLNYLNKFEFNIQPNRLILEEVAVDTSISYRDKIINLVNYSLEEGNVLIIKSLDSLGANFSEMFDFIKKIDSKKISLICLDFSKNEIKGDLKKVFFHFIKMGVDFEEKFKNRNNVKNHVTKRVGRPEILNQEQKREVLQKFKKGYSVYALAKEFSVTRTVIQRILNKENEKYMNSHKH